MEGELDDGSYAWCLHAILGMKVSAVLPGYWDFYCEGGHVLRSRYFATHLGAEYFLVKKINKRFLYLFSFNEALHFSVS